MTAPTLRELAARFGLRRCGREWRGRCPACGYATGLTLSGGEAGRLLWWCASCQDQAAVAAALGLGSDAAAAPGSAPPRAGAPPADGDNDKRAAAVRMWDAAVPAEGTVVARYLATRGVAAPAGAPLRLLPGARHPGGSRWPAMLALVVDHAGRPAAVHRTFLARDGSGKAPVEPQRMTFGPVAGGAVRLFPLEPGAPLVLAEGIETALAAAMKLCAPAWSAVSAGNLRDTLRLPDAARDVILAVDNDPPGRDAADRAAARFLGEGRRVRLARPGRAGADFNDVLLLRGSARRG